MHTLLDEINDYGGDLKYGWTLNDIDTLEVSLSLSSPKCTTDNMQYGNHIELVDEDNNVVWGGIIFGHSFEDTALKLNCLDYNALLKYRRLRAKQYPAMQYGALMKQMILDVESASPEYPVGLTGHSIADGAIQTTRKVENTDMLWAKIKEFGDDVNYDYWVGTDRKFNFSLRRGTDKPQYTLEWGGDRDNIISKPTLAQDIMSLANSVYAETDGDTPLTSSASDDASKAIYGLFEGTFSPNDGVSVQSTLDAQSSGELLRSSTPATSITLSISDSELCPFSDIGVGDSVTVHLIPYFDFTAVVRILRMIHDEKSNTREMTVGSIIFKPQPPAKRLYKG